MSVVFVELAKMKTAARELDLDCFQTDRPQSLGQKQSLLGSPFLRRLPLAAELATCFKPLPAELAVPLFQRCVTPMHNGPTSGGASAFAESIFIGKRRKNSPAGRRPNSIWQGRNLISTFPAASSTAHNFHHNHTIPSNSPPPPSKLSCRFRSLSSALKRPTTSQVNSNDMLMRSNVNLVIESEPPTWPSGARPADLQAN